MTALARRDPVWTFSAIRVATAALLVETLFAATGLALWGIVTHPDPDGDDSGIFGVVFLPVAVPFFTAFALLLTVALVLPALSLAGRAGARWGHGGAWWWVPVAGAAVPACLVAAVGLVVAVVSGTVGSWAVYGWCWCAVTALVVPAALLARATNRRAAAGRPALLARNVALGGCGALVAFLALFVGTVSLVDAAGS
ncbi:hypothetical protein AB0K89_26090 [Streptomyces cinnamoneus]|uniref:hypothetical protein n=1 Tax=Streptomyces cinnamoneus TaxID=53446 RepID=UPI003444583B